MENGIIFMPDISGYSHFVRETDTGEGATIVAALLDALITENHLSFEISEIEGDAILFYRHGKAFPVQMILQQFNQMLRSFNAVKERFMTTYPQIASLSLKLIVHYGTLAMYSVKGFAKLYGKAVVEAHRLMKNNVDSDTYVLVTDAYMQESGNAAPDGDPAGNSVKQCENYSDIGKLCYTFFPTLALTNYNGHSRF